MPAHDWTRIEPGIFHDFHHSWIEELKRALNSGLLPPGHDALATSYQSGLASCKKSSMNRWSGEVESSTIKSNSCIKPPSAKATR